MRVTLLSLQRFPRLTHAGNPRWKLTTSNGVFNTCPDAAVNYGISNDAPEGKEVDLVLDDKGDVIGFEIATN